MFFVSPNILIEQCAMATFKCVLLRILGAKMVNLTVSLYISIVTRVSCSKLVKVSEAVIGRGWTDFTSFGLD